MEDFLAESYVSLETAKMLKKHGLDVVCGSYFVTGEDKKDKFKARFKLSSVTANRNTYQSELPDHEYITCPSLGLAMSWLRRKYNLVIETTVYPHEDGVFYWGYKIGYMETDSVGYAMSYQTKYKKAGFDTYEEAVESAIKQAENYMNF